MIRSIASTRTLWRGVRVAAAVSLLLAATGVSCARARPQPVAPGAQNCGRVPGVRVFASMDGLHSFRMTEGRNPKQPTTGRLFTRDAAGREKTVWNVTLVNVPARVLVAPDGQRVVTIGTHCSTASNHAVVVYGAGGQILADHRREDVLTFGEQPNSIESFLFMPDRLKIGLSTGREIFIHLGTGNVIGRSGNDWLATLPVRAGKSLEAEADGRQKQVVTFFHVNEIRPVRGSVFIAGSGYVEINGGGTIFAGPNRAMDPYLEVTVTAPEAEAFQECTKMLTSDTLVENAVAVSGDGYFARKPGIGERRLGIVRLDTIASCKLVPRR